MTGNDEALNEFHYCAVPDDPVREFAPETHPGRAAAIINGDRKWVSGTTLHYYFFEPGEFAWNSRDLTWIGDDTQKAIVRDAFQTWADLGIGIEFQEVFTAAESEIRIGFVGGDGSWSWLGRRILDEPITARTMNFGWDLRGQPDTAVHEIGHTLGMPHEHQNPFAGIVWDDEAVYANLGAPPNNWSRDKTFRNILRKLPTSSVAGSAWDPNSVMHYPFDPGLILAPEKYRNGLRPNPGLSPADKRWAKQWYPPVRSRISKLHPFESRLVSVDPGDQAAFRIEPATTRRYTIRTIGESDTVMVLFHEVDGEWHRIAANDDSGNDLNATIEERLIAGERYEVHIRLYWAADSGDFGVVHF